MKIFFPLNMVIHFVLYSSITHRDISIIIIFLYFYSQWISHFLREYSTKNFAVVVPCHSSFICCTFSRSGYAPTARPPQPYLFISHRFSQVYLSIYFLTFEATNQIYRRIFSIINPFAVQFQTLRSDRAQRDGRVARPGNSAAPHRRTAAVDDLLDSFELHRRRQQRQQRIVDMRGRGRLVAADSGAARAPDGPSVHVECAPGGGGPGARLVAGRPDGCTRPRRRPARRMLPALSRLLTTHIRRLPSSTSTSVR